MEKSLTEIEQNLQTGDIILISSEGFVPEIIQRFQGNKWNHAGIIIKIESDCYISEATENGVIFSPLSKYFSNTDHYDIRVLRYRKDLNYNRKKIITRLALTSTNRGYDFLNLVFHQVIKFTTKAIFGKPLWIGAKNDRAGAKRFVCGEWVGYLYFYILGLFEDWRMIAPVKLAKSPYFYIVLSLEKNFE